MFSLQFYHEISTEIHSEPDYVLFISLAAGKITLIQRGVDVHPKRSENVEKWLDWQSEETFFYFYSTSEPHC